jgi:hypothetical protein
MNSGENNETIKISLSGLGCEIIVVEVSDQELNKLVSYKKNTGLLDQTAIQEVFGHDYWDFFDSLFHFHCPLADGLCLDLEGEVVEFPVNDQNIIPFESDKHIFRQPFDIADPAKFGYQTNSQQFLLILSMEEGQWANLTIPKKDFNLNKFKLISNELNCGVQTFRPIYGYEYNGDMLHTDFDFDPETTICGLRVFALKDGEVCVS